MVYQEESKKKYNYINGLIMIVITLICPPAGLVLALFCLSKGYQNWKSSVFCIAYSMAVFAYCYEPTVDSDLVRYHQVIQQVKGMSFVDALNYNLYGEGNLYTFMAISWVLGKLSQPNLLQAISVFSVIYIAVYVNYRIAIDYKFKNKDSFYSLLFLLLNLNFYILVNNVRNIFAFSLICYAVFRELYLKKKNIFTILLYIIPCFMHASAILLVLFRLILPFTKRIKWVLLIFIISMKFVVGYLSGFLGGISGGNVIVQLIVNMLNKGNRYYNNYDSAWALAAHSSGSMQLMKIVLVLECVIITIVMFKNLNILNEKVNNIEMTGLVKSRINFINYLFLIDIMGFACVPMYMPEYWRFLVVIVLFNGVIVMSDLKKMYSKNIIYYMQLLLVILAPIYFILTTRDLIIYSKIISMIVNAFFCNPITIWFWNAIV
nr:EpsG family protein [uncultured Blautia sp.]